MSAISFYVRVIKVLDEIGAPYMIVGSFGGYLFGLSRATYDIDILVDLQEKDFDTLSENFPSPRYYADADMMRNAVRENTIFNIIDTNEGIKADLVPVRDAPEYRLALKRRTRRNFIDPVGNAFSAWVAQPTDIIIGKLRAWNDGRSVKHLGDIHLILFFCLHNHSDDSVDLDEISAIAATIGEEVLDVWKKILARTQEELQKGNTSLKW